MLRMLKQLCGNTRQMVMHVEMVLIVSEEAPGKFSSDLDYFIVCDSLLNTDS